MVSQPSHPGSNSLLNPHASRTGDTAQMSLPITEHMVQIYAALTGDTNPIHTDPETGRKSVFGTNIAHGMLVGSFFGPVIVNELIGPGAIYRKQTLEFEAPVPIGEEITAVVSVKEVKAKEDKTVYILQTECFLSSNPSGTRVISGEAVIVVLKS